MTIIALILAVITLIELIVCLRMRKNLKKEKAYQIVDLTEIIKKKNRFK